MRRFIFFLRDILFKNTSVRVAVGFSVLLLAETWLYPAWFQAPVLVNGRIVMRRDATKAKAVVEAAGFRSAPGNLVDVDGKTLKIGAGFAPRLRINGRAAGMQTTIRRDDVVEFIPGGDKMESIQTSVEDILLVTRVEGDGEYTIVANPGRPGAKAVVRGSVSGKIVSAKTLSKAKAMRVVRTAIKPPKVVALTFDDGPSQAFTSQVVQVLKDARASATFFMLGREMAARPEAAREVFAAGFQIANHSFSHSRLDHASEPELIKELDDTRNQIFSITNTEPKWFRPPYGASSPTLTAIAEAKGYRVIRWNIDTRDWEAPGPEDIVNRVVAGVFPGAVVLMHDGGGNRTNTVVALPKMIQALYKQGYSFVTLDQLVK